MRPDRRHRRGPGRGPAPPRAPRPRRAGSASPSPPRYAEPGARAFAQALELRRELLGRARGPALARRATISAPDGGERRIERAGQTRAGPAAARCSAARARRDSATGSAGTGGRRAKAGGRDSRAARRRPRWRAPRRPEGTRPRASRRRRRPPARAPGRRPGSACAGPAARTRRRPIGRGAALDAGLDLKAGPLEPGHLLVRRAAEGAEQHRVVDGLEQVGLALGVGAQQDQAGRGELAIEVRQVAEPSSHQMAEPHYSMRICRLTKPPCIAEHIDAIDLDDHRGAAEADGRELQGEVHRVLPLPQDRRRSPGWRRRSRSRPCPRHPDRRCVPARSAGRHR